jgi:glycosyltransferase involved in cell wall biosynthesis
LKKLSVIVPFYNEVRTLDKLIGELEKHLVEIGHEIIFVNDGSFDGSLELLNSRLKSSNLNSLVLSQTNQGKSSAVRAGILRASGTHVIILDADLELEVLDIKRMWSIVTSGISDFVMGYREFRSHSSFTYRYSKGNLLLSNLFGILFNVTVSDIMCGFKLLPTSFLRTTNLKSNGFSIEAEIHFRIWQKNIRPYELLVSYTPRSREQGKTISTYDGLKLCLLMARWRLSSIKFIRERFS